MTRTTSRVNPFTPKRICSGSLPHGLVGHIVDLFLSVASWAIPYILLGAVVVVPIAVVSWFTIVISGVHINVIRRYTRYYLRWRVRALAYMMLLVDRYPPFGDATYPATLTLTLPETRDRLTVGFRILLAIPHFIVLFFLVCAWWVTSLVSWLLILFTGDYPQGLYDFGAAVLRWLIRVEAYVLLMVDEYPPFAFE